MELDELKEIWKDENRKLEERIAINERNIQTMNMNKTLGEVNKLIKLSILGRNLALVYCAISLLMAWGFMGELEYSIPAIIGAGAMLWSFISHLPIKKPDYENDSIMALQKSISKFRIHSATNANYDIFIVLLWVLTLIPPILKLIFNLSLYTSVMGLVVFSIASGVFIAFTIVQSKKIYLKYEQELTRSEAYLAKIIEFENE